MRNSTQRSTICEKRLVTAVVKLDSKIMRFMENGFEQRHSPPPLRWELPVEKAVSSTTAKTTKEILNEVFVVV